MGLLCSFLLFTENAMSRATNHPQAEANRSLVRRFAQIAQTKELSELEEIIAEGYIQHNPMVPAGLKGLQEGFGHFLQIFPDATATIQHLICEGDLVVGHFTWEATHSGTFLGVPATGKKVAWKSMDIWRVENGKLAEHWDVIDWAGFLKKVTDTTNVR